MENFAAKLKVFTTPFIFYQHPKAVRGDIFKCDVRSSPSSILTIRQNGAMRCFVAGELADFNSDFDSLKEEQNFAYFFLKNINLKSNYYFITSDPQLEARTGKILNFLINMGAECLDKRPNRNEGKNNNYLYCLSLETESDRWNQFLHPETRLPLWVYDLSEDESEDFAKVQAIQEMRNERCYSHLINMEEN